MRVIATSILILLAVFTGTAIAAQAAVPSDGSLLDYLRPVIDAAVGGHPLASAALGVVFLCAAARRYMPSAWKTGTKGDVIGVATSFAMAFFGHVGYALLAPGAELGLALLAPAFNLGIVAIGGFTVIHKVAGWIMGWSKTPPWLVAILRVLTSIVGSSAVKKAEVAGDKAVAADPPKGMKGDDSIEEVE